MIFNTFRIITHGGLRTPPLLNQRLLNPLSMNESFNHIILLYDNV